MQSLRHVLSPAPRTAPAWRRGPRRSPRPRRGRARAPRATSTISMRPTRVVRVGGAEAALFDQLAERLRDRVLAPCARRRAGHRTRRVRAPHCASTCAMPRPMVPAPATPATRSLRLGSSKRLILAAGVAAIIAARRRSSMKQIFGLAAGAAACALAAQAQQFPSKPVTLIVPVAGGRQHRHLLPQARRGRRAAPRPAAGDREPARAAAA